MGGGEFLRRGVMPLFHQPPHKFQLGEEIWHRLRHPLVRHPSKGGGGSSLWGGGFFVSLPSSVYIQEIKRKRLSEDVVEVEPSGCWVEGAGGANMPMEAAQRFFFHFLITGAINVSQLSTLKLR